MPRLKFRPAILDVIIFFLIISCGIFLTVKTRYQTGSKVTVNANGTTYEYSLSKNGTYKVQGELGETTFEIKNSRIRITDSPCPNKYCIAQGWHNPLVCLPNKVIITIQSEDELDAVSE